MKIKQLFSKWFNKKPTENVREVKQLIRFVTFKDLGIEQKGKIDWENTGLLRGLNKEEILFTLKYLDQIDFDIIKNVFIKNYIAPVVIRICLNVYHRRYQLYSKVDKGISQKRVIKLISIEEILENLEIYSNEYLPIVKKYLPNMEDITPEMIKFFCEDYVYGIINKLS